MGIRDWLQRLSGNPFDSLGAEPDDLITIAGRRYQVNEESHTDSYIRGTVTPYPKPAPTMVALTGTEIYFPSNTELRYKIVGIDDKAYEEGHFQQIEVQPEDQRMGIATGMVEALFEKYPEVMFQNENLNDQSGLLFQKIAKGHPDHMHQVYWDEPRGKWMITIPPASQMEAVRSQLPLPAPLRTLPGRSSTCGIPVVSADGAPCIRLTHADPHHRSR